MSSLIDYRKLLKSLEKLPFNKSEMTKIAEEPGIYIFWGDKRNVNYIGKAKNLKRRLSSYTLKNLLEKTRKMVSVSSHFSVIKVTSEIESLLLESNLIKETQPLYNVQAKDDKNPLYIVVTKDEYPTVTTARKMDALKKGSYYGPFPSSTNVKFTLKLLRRIFPYAQHKLGKRACFYSQLGLCKPCPNAIEQTDNVSDKLVLRKKYLKNIRYIRMFLNSNLRTIERELEGEMRKFVKTQSYEEAGEVKAVLEKIRYITQPIIPVKHYLENPNLADDVRQSETDELKKILSVYISVPALSRIECFDIAHIAGSATTASMITFVNGKPEKELYRRFKIRYAKKSDDVDAMREVAARRLKHMSDWGYPDLILVDGGKAQINAFASKMNEVSLPVVGLAKRFETLIIPLNERDKFVNINIKRGPAGFLLQRMRNEAHRFARSYHHLLLKKELLGR